MIAYEEKGTLRWRRIPERPTSCAYKEVAFQRAATFLAFGSFHHFSTPLPAGEGEALGEAVVAGKHEPLAEAIRM